MKKTKTTLDALSAVFWFAFGLAVCYGAVLLGVGSANNPDSGFIFFWSGVMLAFLSLMILTESWRVSATESLDRSGTHWPKIMSAVVALVLYGLLLEKLGFIVTTILLLSFYLRLGEEKKWLNNITVASAAALGSMVIFELWLRIKLPKGILGF